MPLLPLFFICMCRNGCPRCHPHADPRLYVPRKRTKTRFPATRRQASPVTVQTIESQTGWSVEEALELIWQGYTPEHVQRLTGHKLAGIARLRGILQ